MTMVQDPPKHEIVDCFCGANDYTVVMENIPSGRLVKCNKCGMHYANPRSLRLLVKKASGEDIAPDVDLDKVKEPERWDKTFKFRLKVLNKHAPSKGKFLDVGCYAGFLLKLAKDDGWETLGVEPTVGGAKYGQEMLGLNIDIGTLEEAQYQSESFDAVGLFEVIEHVPNPNSVVSEAHRILKPGGVFLVETPTINNIWVKLLKGKWRHFISGHFWFFTEKRLAALLDQHGFEILDTLSVSRYTSLRHLVGVLRQHFRPLAVLLDIVCVKILRLGSVIIYLNPRDNFLIVARKRH